MQFPKPITQNIRIRSKTARNSLSLFVHANANLKNQVTRGSPGGMSRARIAASGARVSIRKFTDRDAAASKIAALRIRTFARNKYQPSRTQARKRGKKSEPARTDKKERKIASVCEREREREREFAIKVFPTYWNASTAQARDDPSAAERESVGEKRSRD